MIPDGYYIDLSAFSLEKLKNQLKTTRLLPSQKILRENIDERFACLAQHGIQNLAQLQKSLNSKADMQSFSEQTGLPVDYLTILRREVNSNQPKPIDLKDFPGIRAEVAQRLAQRGIKNTAQLFPLVLTVADRQALAQEIQVTVEDILDLTCLTDVARTKWVGPKFARLLVASGYGSLAKISSAEPESFYQTIQQANQDGTHYQGGLGPDDLKAWILTVQDVPQLIEHETSKHEFPRNLA
jgi:hypothetical protein